MPPFECTGPRFYVSLTKRAMKQYGEGPALPVDIAKLVWPHPEDFKGIHRVRGLGWALAPPGSDPQQLHADIWGGPEHCQPDHCRFPHIIWKRTGEDFVTTEFVPRGFTQGQSSQEHYDQLTTAASSLVIFNSECLHRGAGVSNGDKWASSCSIELCSPSGWAAWTSEGGTEGTIANPEDGEWAMLCIHGQGEMLSFDVADATPPPVNYKALRAEQQRWESEY